MGVTAAIVIAPRGPVATTLFLVSLLRLVEGVIVGKFLAHGALGAA